MVDLYINKGKCKIYGKNWILFIFFEKWEL